MANDLGTIGILVDVRGMPLVKELATTLNQTAVAHDKVSNSAREVIRKLKEERAAMREVAAANTLAGASFSRLHLNTVAKNMDTLTSSTLRYSRAAQQSMQGANRFGMVSQQVGYQVGDFFVQVQSGTNALTAFGQQATQLAGLLPGLAGAIVGIGISLGTALGMAALRSQEMTINFQKIGQDVLAALAPVQGLISAIGTGLSYAGQAAAKGMELLIQNLDRIFIYGTTIAALFAGKYIAGMVAATAATASLSGALLFLRGALIKTGIGALVVVAGELVYQFTRLVDAAGSFGKSVGLLWNVVSEFGSKVVALFNSLKSTFESAAHFLSARFIQAINNVLGNFIEMTNVVADELNLLFSTDVFQGAGGEITQQLAQVSIAYEDSAIAAANAADAYYESATGPFESIKKLNEVVQETTDSTVDLSSWLTETGEAAKGTTKAAEDLRKELQSPLVSAVGSVSDAFGDFVARGLTDFKGFVKQILGSFQSMISQMIAMAVKNRIMLSLGIGGITPGMAAAGQVAGLGSAGGMMGSLGIGQGVAGLAGGTGFLGGAGNAIAGLGGGGAGFFGIGANAAAAGGGALATIGAAIPVIAAVAAVFSFFKKSVKELDSGLRITVGNMDAFVETFKTIQTKRFWGLSKKVTTTVEEASTEISDPIVEAVIGIQEQVLKAAEMFGIAESEFEDFVYKFDLSLKGLTDEQKLQKINEELLKMGDAFASLSDHFTSMNELLAAAQQRYDLQTRLLELQGDTEALLARQRELELAAVHDLNRELLLQIHTLEDVKIAEEAARKALEEQQRALEVYQRAVDETTQVVAEATRAYESALGDLRNAMARQLSEAQSALDSAKSVFDTALSNRYESLQNNLGSTEQALADAQQALAEAQRRAFEEGIQNRITAVNASFNSLIANLEASLDVAQRKAEASRQVFEVLDSALRDRRLASEAATFASRRSALSYVSSGGTDIDKLTGALGVLNEPSEQFFGTFQDYARDFALTTNAIKENRDLAEATMTADEKTVMLLEQQIEQSRASQEAQVEALEKMLVVQEDFLTVSQAMEKLLTAQENYDQAKEAHDELLLQYPQLQETFISVGDALANYLAAQATFEQVQAQHAELIAQYPMLNESVLTVAQAVTNLGSAIAAQTAATAAQVAAQTALANAIAAANQVPTTESVPGFAAGGMFSGGPRIVGENGPELEVTGPSRIYSSRDTAGMFRDPNLASAVNGLRKEVSGMRSEQLQIQVEVSKNVKRIYDIERKWDTDGLPPERV